MNTRIVISLAVSGFDLFCVPVHADPVMDWNSVALETIWLEQTPPPMAASNPAILQTAVFDAGNSFSEAAPEAGMSRIYGGIHFWSADMHGLLCGAKLGDYVSEPFLLPRPGNPH